MMLATCSAIFVVSSCHFWNTALWSNLGLDYCLCLDHWPWF